MINGRLLSMGSPLQGLHDLCKPGWRAWGLVVGLWWHHLWGGVVGMSVFAVAVG